MMDETWGLSWSKRWHAVDNSARPPWGVAYGQECAMSLCGSGIYTQQQIRDARAPYLQHLKEIVYKEVEAAGVCKKCEKAVHRRVEK